MDGAPFGAFQLPLVRERIRALIGDLPSDRLSRSAASLLRRLSLAGWHRPVDLESGAGVRVRLHPHDNATDRQYFMWPDRWDHAEREAIVQTMRAALRSRPFVFVDVGANNGLYSLSLLNEARRQGREARILAIEPEPVNVARLRFNVEACGAGQDVIVAPIAATCEAGRCRLTCNEADRGSSGVRDHGVYEVEQLPLAAAIEQAGFGHVDAMKLDIEGIERWVLETFLATAPKTLYPSLIVVEVIYHFDTIVGYCEAAGYRLSGRSGFNAIFQRVPDGETRRHPTATRIEV